MDNRPPQPEQSGLGAPKGGSDQPFWSFLMRHADKLIGLGLVASFALGCSGYYEYLPEHSDDWNWTDVVYNTLQLFILEVARDTESPEKWNWMIHVARFTAPGFVTWSAFQIFLVNIKSWRHSQRRSALKDHCVVIGTGRTADLLERNLLDNHTMVVRLRPPVANLSTEVDGESHLFSVCGELTNPDVLKMARLQWAKKVIVASGDDNENVMIAEAIQSWLEGRGLVRDIACHMEMSPGPSSPLHREEVANHLRIKGKRKLTPSLFQPQRIAARELVRVYAPHHVRCPGTPGSMEGPPIHALVVGFEPFGKEVVKQLIRVCHYLDRKSVRITIVAENARRAFKRFEKEVPALSLVADVVMHPADPSAMTSEAWDELQGRGEEQAREFDIAYITTSDTGDAYTVAMDAMDGLGTLAKMKLHPESGSDLQQTKPEKVIVCSSTKLLCKSDKVERFDPEKETWTADHLLKDDLDLLSKRIHERYYEKNCDEMDPGRRQGLKHWDDLPEHDRDANRDQADHIAVKLLLLGLSERELLNHVPELTQIREAESARLAPAEALSNAGKRLALARAFDELSRKYCLPDIEALAEVEHRRWMASKALAGYAKGKNNKQQRLHQDMVPYGELDSATKDKDLDVIRDLPIDLLNFKKIASDELDLGNAGSQEGDD